MAEFGLWPEFWDGTPAEVEQAITHTQELIDLIIGGTTVKAAVYREEYASGVSHGAPTGDTWYKRLLNTIYAIGDLGTIVDNEAYLPGGDYLYFGQAASYGSQFNRLRLVVPTYSITQYGLVNYTHTHATYHDYNHALISGVLSLPGDAQVKLEHYIQVAEANYGMGSAINQGVNNVYATLTFIKFA